MRESRNYEHKLGARALLTAAFTMLPRKREKKPDSETGQPKFGRAERVRCSCISLFYRRQIFETPEIDAIDL